jgi:WD40 repeat protein
MGSSASAAAFKKANASNAKQRRKTQVLPAPELPDQPLPVLPSKVDVDPVPPTQNQIGDQGADNADESLPSELPEDEVDEIPDTFNAESEIENEEETEVINTKEVEQERALRKNKKERAIQVLAHEKQAEASSKLLAMSSELIREQDNEVAMEAVASKFLPRRKTQKKNFQYDEFKSIERAYRRSLVAKQQEAIRRSQNQAKDDKQEAMEMASFLRIHKAISDLEGWGPGLRLSCQQGEWTVVGISQNSGASVSGIRLGDKLVSVGGQVVSGMQFDRIRSLLLGPKDTNVFVTVLKKKFLWSSNQQYVLLRSLPSASFDFSSKDVIEKTLARASFVEDLEAAAKNAEKKLRDEMNAALAAEEEARNATALAILNLHNHFVSAPHLDDAAISLVHTTITSNVKNMGMPSFVISVHNRSISTEIKDFSMRIADQLALFIRSFHMEPVINIIQDYKRDVMSKSTWRSSIEQGASTNGIPVCVLIWDLDHWNIWQLWMQRHHNAMTETNRSIEVYRKKLLNFDDDDFIQEALHIFSAKNAAQVSRIFVFVEKTIEPSALLNLVRTDLMQLLFHVDLQQVVFVFRENIRIDLSIFQRMAYTTVSSFFQQLTLYSFTQYFSNLLSLLLKSVTNITASIQDRGPEIRKLLCSGKSVITSHFIPTKQFSFSAEQIVQSHESLNEKYLLKQPQHVILHSMIQNWPNNPVSTKPGKKLFVFTPEISGFSSALDWISESLRARPHGLEDIVPILIRIPKRFQRTGLAESQSVIFALNAVFEDTLSAPPFNFLGARDPNLEVSTVSPEQLMESFSKMLSVACKQLNLRFLIMFDNIHYINFDADNMGCIQWTLSRMPENVRIVYPFLLNSQMHLSLKSHLDLMVKKSLAGSLDIELLQGLEYRQIPVFTSHQRYFFGCFIKSGTLCQVLAEKLCEDYFAWYLHINPNMETHIWLLISTGYVMVHHLWHIAIKPIEMFLPSGLNSLIAIIVKDFSSILSGSTMLTAARIMTTANCGITITEIVKVMMLLCGHRDEVFKRKFEYHQSCRLLFETPGQAQALQRFCCIFARMEGQGFSTSSLLMLNAHVDRILNDVILEILGPLPEIPSYDSVKQVIFEFVVFSCNLKSTASGFDFKSESSVQGHQLRQFSIMTDFALSLKDKRTFVLALTSSRIVHARIVMGCIDWVIGNILQALRMAVDFDESDLSQLFDLFRSLISHKSRAPLLRIQPDLYFSIMSTTPSKEYLCQRTLDILEQSGAPWLRHINKQTYFPFPINNLADLPTEASAVATSKRGHLVAAGDFSGNVAVWAVSSSDLLCIFKSHSQAITGIFFSSLDYIIVSCSVDFSININSVYSSSVLTTITPHTQPISCMDVWLKESVSFATVSRDGFAAITTLNMRAIAARSSAWTAIKDGTTQTEFKEEELGALLLQPSSVTFTFQVSSFEVKAENVHTNFVKCIACHPVDTGVCATGSRDSSIIVWKVDFVSSTSVCMFRYVGHNHWILSLDWMPVGYTILSSSMSSAVHVWRVPWEEYVQIKIGSNESSGDFQADQLLMHGTVDRNQLTDPKISRLRNGDDTHVIVDGDDDDFSEFDGARIFMEREEKEIAKVSIAAGSLPVVIHAASETNPKYDDVVSVFEKI